MTNYNKLIAGFTVGVGAIALILTGNIEEGAILLSGMMGFFVGDNNGQKETERKIAKALEEISKKTD